jgi:hypothetical protein
VPTTLSRQIFTLRSTAAATTTAAAPRSLAGARFTVARSRCVRQTEIHRSGLNLGQRIEGGGFALVEIMVLFGGSPGRLLAVVARFSLGTHGAL